MLNKFENWVFWFFLFAIPISTRHIFAYQSFNFIEWQSFYIYGTDILLLVLLGFWFGERRETFKQNVRRPVGPRESKNLAGFYAVLRKVSLSNYFLLAFVAISAISIRNALDVSAAWFQWAKLAEGFFLYFYVKSYAVKRFNLPTAFMAIVVGGLFQSIIALVQFWTQHSIGLSFLGESVLSQAMSGIAAFYVGGNKIIRAYGTTPHSNVLAAYLFISISAFYNIAIYKKLKWWWHIGHAIILLAFFFTFSRTIIAIWGLTFLIRAYLIRFSKFKFEFWQNLEMRQRALNIFFTTLIVGAAFCVVYWPYVVSRIKISSDEEAVQLRVLYNQESLKTQHNWFGVGMGNFVPWLMTQDLHLPRQLYQPVHNIYLLAYSETGITGVSLFAIFLTLLFYEYYKRTQLQKLYHYSFAIVAMSLLFFGLFDHFLWTIQSGRLLLWLSLGLIAGTE